VFTTSTAEFKRPVWQTIVIFTLAFWLSSSLFLDVVIMPSLYTTGMMATPDFASAGYVIFGIFNRVELLCAGLVLSSFLAACHTRHTFRGWNRTAVLFSLLLFAVVSLFTYILTPEMSALGLSLNLFETSTTVPTGMNELHGSYWLLEVLKLAIGATLLSVCYRRHLDVAAKA
jgi:hypothetical protein